MAFQPIYGYSGDHPVLNYAGTTPICMEPYLHTPGLPENPFHYDSEVLVVSANTIHVSRSDNGFAYGQADFFYLYTGTASKTVTLTYGGNWSSLSGGADLSVGGAGINVSLALKKNGPTSLSFNVPYYRYSVLLSITGTAEAAAWAQVTIS